MRTSLLAWWAAACLVRGAAAGALIVQAPDFGGGVNKTLVIVGGASIANAKYAPLGRAIQRFAAANNLSLWVAIPAFPLDTPNPAALPAKVEEAYAATFDGSRRATSSRGTRRGIFSQALVHGSSYAGLVLLGSYLSTVYGATRRWRCAGVAAVAAANVSAAFAVDEDDAASLAGFDLANPDIAGAAVRVVSRAARRRTRRIRRRVARAASTARPSRGVPPRALQRVGRRGAADLRRGERRGPRRRAAPGGQRDRYDADGRTARAFSDRTVATGLGWQAAALDVAAADGAVATSAPLLATADAALCKLLPVSRAVEIALVDGLPRFDGSFAL
ncbi:hypothetical protein JL720_16049 [Aureococcus anophagefferens]|nr:hypothetical protein JL720_16049 [Aureococcus anophagefferens]